MKNSFKRTLLATAIAVSTMASIPAMAAVEGNIGVANNYIWRGVTQTNDQAAVSGGLDYSADSGFYAGTWVSNLGGPDYELDLYAGYGVELGTLNLDLGLITYQYPVSETYFHEVYVNTSINILNLGLSYTLGSDDDDTGTFSQGDFYGSIGADFDIGNDLALGLVVGSYSFDGDSDADYTHFGASISKGDFSFALDKTDEDNAAGNPRVTVSWSKTF